ncbi:hypothetical protein FRC02_002575 [Tulasnella sp. 418]|nr:hypothetical protein FRC02_002575 [Tulasnella sp. 418]
MDLEFVLSTSRKPLLPPSEAHSLTFSTFSRPPPHILSSAKTTIVPPPKPIIPPSVSAAQTPSALTQASPSLPGTPRSSVTSVSTAPPQTPPATTSPKTLDDGSQVNNTHQGTTTDPPSTKPNTTPAPPAKPPPKSWAGLFAKPASTSTSAVIPPPPQLVARPPSPFVSPSNPQALLTGSPSSSSSAAPLIHPRGLVNPGNHCFANSILQVLVHTPPFYRLFIHGLAPILDGNDNSNFMAGVTNRTTLLQATLGFLREFKLASQLDLPKDPLPGEENPFMVSRNKKGSNTGTSTPLTVEQLRRQSFLQDPFIPDHLYETMRENKRFESITKGHQEDAEEFLGFFLDTIHEELLFVTERLDAAQNSPMSPKNSGKMPLVKNPASARKNDDDAREVLRPLSPNQLVLTLNGSRDSPDGDSNGWMEVGKKNKVSTTRTVGGSSRESAITKMFGGKLRSVLKVPGAAKDSATLEPYQHLQLDIQPDSVNTIEDALHQLTLTETVSVHSQSKGVDVSATKQVYIESLPPVLCLHLKRFIYDAREGGVGIIKNQKTIGYGKELEISPEWLSPSQRIALEVSNNGSKRGVKYRLFGVVYHHGKFATGGHYTLDVLRQDQSEWLRIDDTYIEPVVEDEVVIDLRKAPNAAKKGTTLMGNAKDAYLLFYQKLSS